MSQPNDILNALRHGDRLTVLDCFVRFGCNPAKATIYFEELAGLSRRRSSIRRMGIGSGCGRRTRRSDGEVQGREAAFVA